MATKGANYKQFQRFINQVDPREALLRLFQSEASFMIGDPTEMPRPQAKKTEYVGTMSDGETSGYWLLFPATPYQGCAIPCHCVSYSSKTINQEAASRNQHHFEAFAKIKELLGESLREKMFPTYTPKHKLYSDLFVLLKLKPTLSSHDFFYLSLQTLASFSWFILNVRTHV